MFKTLFKGVLKITAVIVLSVLALSFLGWIGFRVYESTVKRQAEPYEAMKTWTRDVKDPLGLELVAKTKLVDGILYANISLKGYPPYLSDPELAEKNKQGWISVLFYDKDDFKLHERRVNMLDFSRRVGDDGKPISFDFQGTEPLSVDVYSKFDHVSVQWNLDTSAPVKGNVTVPEPTSRVFADQCAPNLSKAERLKRLAQYGTVRETALHTYSAGSHEIEFAFTPGDVMSCR